jgi:hypothetical protein
MASTHPASITKPLQETRGQLVAKRKPKLANAARHSSKPKADVAVAEKAEVRRRAISRRAAEGTTSRETKTQLVLKKLQSPKGASITQMMDATGWQAHSVRGFLSAVVRAKLGLTLVSEISRDGIRLYRVEGEANRPE